MIEHIGRANMDYMVRLANEPAWAKAEHARVQAEAAAEGAAYNGKPVPVPVKPHFISPRQRRVMERAVHQLHGALERFILHWLESDELQKLWGVGADELELYRVDPGYENSIQVARFDAFLHEYELRFLEFNCDSPGGSGYADVIHRSFLRFFERNHLGSRYEISSRDRLMHLREALLGCYAQWRMHHPNRPEAPYCIVTDWRDVSSRGDIEVTIDRLRSDGVNANFADPRDLELKDDGVYHEGHRVDLVYKRVIVKELIANPDARALTEGYRRGLVCMANSPRSVIVGNKKILAALRRPDVLAKLSGPQREAVHAHVPWTEILQDGKAEFHGFRVDLPTFVRDNKDQLVLKAARSYGGKDVFLGFETDPERWESLVSEHLPNNSWIVQELVKIPKELFPHVKNGQVTMDLLNVNINPLVFGGRYGGSFTRLSRKNVINVSFGGGLTPTMTLKLRDED